MTLIAFASAKGSPGVSVTLAGLARVWPRPAAVADLDPVGGDTLLRYRDGSGEPLNPSRGLLSLGAAVRAGQAADLEEHLQTTAGGMRVLTGVSSPGQVIGLGPAWQHIARTLRSSTVDVLADCGRLAPGSPAMPVVEQADAVVLLVRDGLEDVAHLRERLLGLKATLRIGSIDAIPVGVVVRARASDARSAEDVERLLASSGVAVPSLGVVAEDPKAARVLRHEVPRRLGRSDLMRSLRDVAGRVQELAAPAGRAAAVAG